MQNTIIKFIASHGAATIAVLVFIITYVFIVSERISKVLVAFAGAGVLIVLKIIPQEYAYTHINLTVISLLFSMMLIVKTAVHSGMFEYLAIWSAQKAKGDPKTILFAFIVLTALMSAFLDNVTTVLLVGPVSIFIARQLQISPMPFIISEIFASNIGGTATLIGDPPNLMIGSAAHLTFSDFLVHLGPIVLLQLLLLIVFLMVSFQKQLISTNKARALIIEMNPKQVIKNPILLHKSIVVLCVVIFGFLMHGYLDIESDTIALFGAVALLIWARSDVDAILKEIEWSTLLFFAALFILVSGLEYTGVLQKIADMLMKNITEPDGIQKTSILLIWTSGILSGILDNIPLVATLIPIIKITGVSIGVQSVYPLWWSLSLGACLGGNGTIIGASANVIMVDMARKNNIPLTFRSFLKYSIPVTLISLGVSSLYVYTRYFLF